MQHNHNHIHLFGDPAENFYVLGKRDKDSFSEIYTQISMLCTRSKFMSKVLKTTTELSRKMKRRSPAKDLNLLQAYADGLERDIDDVLFSMLLPEIVASFNKWTPHLLNIIPGCSSLFIKDPNTSDIIHTRILDYALAGPFEKYERSILYEFQGAHKVLSFSTSGMPLPSMTSINDQGLSLALHYKHGQYFNVEGQSIFTITAEIMNTCSNIRDAIKLVKSRQSISYWGLYLSDKNGEVASIDIRGHEVYQEKFDLKDHDYLYFNNRPLLKKSDQLSIQPFGNSSQCQMRRETLESNLKNFDFNTSKNIQIDSLKLLSKTKMNKVDSAKAWKLSPITPSSIQLISFNLSKMNTIFVPGPAPKFFQGDYLEFTKPFSNLDISMHTKKNKSKKNIQYSHAMSRISKYQTSIDTGDISKAYHEIQMAILEFDQLAESYICKFYFIITQYIYETDQKDLTFIYQDLLSLEDKLPSYLEDHRKLFILRTAKRLGQKINNQSGSIKHPELKKVYIKEFNLNSSALKLLKFLIFPRIEILDIIYAY